MLPVLFAFLSACAFAPPYEIINTAEIAARMPEGSGAEKISAFLPVLGERMYPRSILLFLLFLLLYRVLLPRIRREKFSVSAFLTAGLFTVYLLVGESAVIYGTAEVLFQNLPQCLITFLKTAGYLPLFYVLIRAGFAFLDEERESRAGGKLYETVFEKRCFILPLAVILLCWMPYVIAFYPGFVPSDGLKQLNNYFGSGHFTDNHPAFSTMMMGWAMKLGRRLGSDNLGIFLFTGPQLLVNAMVMAACFPVFRKLNSPARLRRIALFQFALIPIWPNYAYSLLKDSYYMAMVLLFVIQIVKMLFDADDFCSGRGDLILMTAALCLLMFVRHEGQFVGAIVFLSLFTIGPVRKHWKRLIPVLLIPLILINIFNHAVRPRLGIDDSPAREALTMPFRQTSAVVLNMEDSLTEEESAVLHELFEYDQIKDMYSVETADFLKGLFDPWAPRDAVLRYLKVWAQLGLKHPLLYLDVFLSSNTRYYDPFLAPHRDIYGWYKIEQESYVNKGLFDIYYQPRTAVLRSVLINIADGLPRLPLTSLFFSLGLNAWIMISFTAYLLRKKIRGVIIPLLPGLITFIMLQNSAINGFFRYLLPLLITSPVCAAWTVFSGQKARKKYDLQI